MGKSKVKANGEEMSAPQERIDQEVVDNGNEGVHESVIEGINQTLTRDVFMKIV